MEPANLSPQQTAIQIPEILENILLHLDEKSLLTSAQRVSRFWHDLVSQPPLQKHLFFQPDWDQKEKVTSELLVENFPLWFPNNAGQPAQSTENMQNIGIVDLRDHRRNAFKTLPIASPLKNEAFMYKDASWRRMLVQQPPIPKLVVFTTANSMMGTFFEGPAIVEELFSYKKLDDLESKPPDKSEPLRMDLFYDTFTIMSHESPSTFMFIWNHGEIKFPPKIHFYTFKEEDKKAMKKAIEIYGMIVATYVVHPCIPAYSWRAAKRLVFSERLRSYLEESEESENEDDES
ncbi:hypothetical protein N7456_008196 [Penicillium angulare]|uniref:F-box domain-containing protein n=1 Tax=Penicillium angulare TaxID=116970 RepID=A0A9W9FC24_9EURO|nr:hypothetical protein N7456_008196 [Penicillium angulare]